MKLQDKEDRQDERSGMMRKEGYKSKEARAGHDYNMSKKHHMAESSGMKKAMDKKYPGSHRE